MPTKKKSPWCDHPIEQLKAEYDIIGLTKFRQKYNVANSTIYKYLWISQHSRDYAIRKKAKVYTSKVVEAYRKKMESIPTATTEYYTGRKPFIKLPMTVYANQ